MANSKKINGDTYRLKIAGNMDGTKTKAKAVAKVLRAKGFSARVIKTKKVIGRVKNSSGKTTKVIKKTRHLVYYKAK